jgi:hypothetical protein
VSTHTTLRIDEMEHAFGGSYVRARAALGVTSFGMQVINLPPNSGDLYPEHDHAFDRQEEVYLLLDGSGEIVLPDAVHPMGRDTFTRVGPGVSRRVRSGPDGLRMLVIGGVPGAVFAPHETTELGGPEYFADPNAKSSMPA